MAETLVHHALATREGLWDPIFTRALHHPFRRPFVTVGSFSRHGFFNFQITKGKTLSTCENITCAMRRGFLLLSPRVALHGSATWPLRPINRQADNVMTIWIFGATVLASLFEGFICLVTNLKERWVYELYETLTFSVLGAQLRSAGEQQGLLLAQKGMAVLLATRDIMAVALSSKSYDMWQMGSAGRRSFATFLVSTSLCQWTSAGIRQVSLFEAYQRFQWLCHGVGMSTSLEAKSVTRIDAKSVMCKDFEPLLLAAPLCPVCPPSSARCQMAWRSQSWDNKSS